MLAETSALAPAAVLAIGAVLLFALRSSLISRNLEERVPWMSAVVAVLLAIWVTIYGAGTQTIADGLLIDDALSRLSQAAVLIAAAASILIATVRGQRSTALDPYILVLMFLAVLGFTIVVSAADLVSFFLGLEFYALAAVALIAQRRNSGKAAAAGLRAALIGLVGSALVLFGLSLIAFALGTTGYSDLAIALTDSPGVIFSVGIALLIAGVACKLALAPFHFWLQPTFEATPWPVIALMAGVAPMAIMSGLARLFFGALGEFDALWQPVFSALGLISVVAGAVAAFAAMRLSHVVASFTTMGTGFGLLALSAASTAGVVAMLAQMGIHCVAMFGIIAFALLLEKDGQPVDLLRDLDGYSKSQMTRAFALLAILLGAAAAPPLAGFAVRLNVLQALNEAGLVWQSLAGVGCMVLAGFAFLRPAWRLYFAPEVGDVETRPSRVADWLLGATALAMGLGLVSLGGLETAIEAAAVRLER